MKQREKGEFSKLFTTSELDEIADIKFMKMLSKRWKEEYKKWLIKKKTLEKILGKQTLILGIRGKDGVVLAADKKVIRGGESEYEEKIRTFEIEEGTPIIFAAAGYVGVTEDFLEAFEQSLKYYKDQGELTSLIRVKVLAEDILKDFEERYAPRLEEYPIEFIFGGLENLNNGKARIYKIGARGYGEKIRYFELIGHGRPYARTIAKFLFYIKRLPELSVEEIAKRAYACLYWIANGGIDDYVGGEPQIVVLKDDKPEIVNLTIKKEEIKDFVETIQKTLVDFRLPISRPS